METLDYLNTGIVDGGGIPEFTDLNILKSYADAHNEQTKAAPGLHTEPSMMTEMTGADVQPSESQIVTLATPQNNYMKWGIIAAAVFIVSQFANLRV